MQFSRQACADDSSTEQNLQYDPFVPYFSVNRTVDSALRAYWLIVGLCVVWIVLSRVMQYRQLRKLIGNGVGAACHSCGYAMVAGSSVICPECGCDVRKSGLITDAAKIPWKRLPMVTLAAVLAIPVAMLCAPTAAQWQPFGWHFKVEAWWYLPDSSADHIDIMTTVRATGYGRFFCALWMPLHTTQARRMRFMRRCFASMMQAAISHPAQAPKNKQRHSRPI